MVYATLSRSPTTQGCMVLANSVRIPLVAGLADGLPAGSYLSDCSVSAPNGTCEDRDGSARKALWDLSEKLIAEAGLVLPETLHLAM